MNKVDIYLKAATRHNTRRSYRSAIEHFEISWGGLLPATSDSIARYLADHAATLSRNTLQLRLAAIARWHIDQGMPDPTKNPLVKKVLRGISALHSRPEKQAKPFQIQQLEQLDAWLIQQIEEAKARENKPAQLKHIRNRALILVGFWRGRAFSLRSQQIERFSWRELIENPL